MRDRLRAIQCPADLINQIGGTGTAVVGQGYGSGYKLHSGLLSLVVIIYHFNSYDKNSHTRYHYPTHTSPDTVITMKRVFE